MGFPILVRQHLYIESGPCILLIYPHKYYMMSVHENYTGILYDVHEREDILVKKFVVEDTQGTFIYITFVSISYLNNPREGYYFCLPQTNLVLRSWMIRSLDHQVTHARPHTQSLKYGYMKDWYFVDLKFNMFSALAIIPVFFVNFISNVCLLSMPKKDSEV